MPRTPTRASAAPPGAAPAPRQQTMWVRAQPWLWITLAGVALRVVLWATLAGYLYPGDHDDFVRWGLQVVDRGLTTLYTEPPERRDMRGYHAASGLWGVAQRPVDRVCNYPPLSTYLLAISGYVYSASWSPLTAEDIDALGLTGRVGPEFGRRPIVNTPASQVIFTFWSVLCDFLLAAGCAAIVWRYAPRVAALLVYAFMLVAPPFWWDSIVWAQTDTIVLAPGVWMVYHLLRGRYIVAGVLWGLALGLKTQGILYTPIWGFAFACQAIRLWGQQRIAALRHAAFWMPVLGGLVAVAVLLVAALPFTVTSGLAWLERSYLENLFKTYTELTTLKAFNIWYLDLLISDNLDARVSVLGLTKATWGTLLLVVGLGAGFVWALWRWREKPVGLLLWTALAFLLIMMLPTKVHERYLILALPWLIIVGGLSWRPWPGLLLLLVVMMAQLSWPWWLASGRGTWPGYAQQLEREYHEGVAALPPERRRHVPPLEDVLAERRAQYERLYDRTTPLEWALTLLALLGAAWCVGALLSLPADAGVAGRNLARPETKTTVTPRRGGGAAPAR